MTAPDSPAAAVRELAAQLRGAPQVDGRGPRRRHVADAMYADALDGVLAELDEARRGIERLRARTHEIQAQEMAKRAELDSQIAEMRSRWQAAKRWTEDVGLLAEWAAGRFASSPFWGMASVEACDALARLVAERDEARRELERLRELLRQSDEQVETLNAELVALPEWRCPSCGPTTHAWMADRTGDHVDAP